MLIDRGYMVSQEMMETSLADFMQHFMGNPAQLDMLVEKTQDVDLEADGPGEPKEKMLVFYLGQDKVSKKDINDYALKMHQASATNCILVVKSALSPMAKDQIATLESYISIEVFNQDELLVNITHHVLVPEHIVLSQEEKKRLLARYRINDSQLPKILTKDPVARYYGMKKGQVAKIIRASETAGRYVTYRVAV